MITRQYLLSAALLVTAGCTHNPGSHNYFPGSLRQSSDNFVFEAQPSIIRPGETALLRWNIQGATSVTIEAASDDNKLQVIGTFGARDTLKCSPKRTRPMLYPAGAARPFRAPPSPSAFA